MPHMVLEYSGNIRETLVAKALFADLHRALAKVGDFRIQDFKSRAVRQDVFSTGDGSFEQVFVNLDIRTFVGKSDAAKKAISETALGVLERYFGATMDTLYCDISVQITELDRASYARVRSAAAVE